MKLQEFEQARKGKQTRYVSAVSDRSGVKNHEMVITGPDNLVKRMFKDSDFDLKIDPGGSKEDWERAMTQGLADYGDGPADQFEAAAMFKRPPSAATPRNAVFVHLRRLTGKGTGYAFGVPLFIPTGARVFFVLPPVCTCGGILFPVNGDPDVFLAINGLGPPFVAASTLGGTAVDRVSFSRVCLPFMHFVPFFRVDGFRSSVCTFFWGGFGLL